MKRLTLTGLAALGLLGFLSVQSASAQAYPYYGPSYGPSYGNYGRSGPALSPWLNLTRGGNPAANYFLGVLPEMDYRATKAVVNSTLQDLERRVDVPGPMLPTGGSPEDIIGDLKTGALPPTGHAAVFTAYGTYYGLTPPSQPPRAFPSAQQRGR
jgi:hypothetical protein